MPDERRPDLEPLPIDRAGEPATAEESPSTAKEQASSPPATAPFVAGGDVGDEDRLVADMLAPPPLEQAQDSVDFWRRRRSALPLYRRRARREAERRLTEAEAQLRAARRAKFGPTLLEQLSEAVGITISPARIRHLLALTAASVVVVVVAFVVAAVAFWPEIEPIVRFFIGGGGGGGGEGGG